MPVLRWTATASELPADTQVTVLASDFLLTSWKDVLSFFAAGTTVRQQALAAEGSIGIWLEAKPLRKYFRFISAWQDEQSLRAMVKADPHREIIKKFRPRMAWSNLVSWEATVDSLPPNWEEVQARLATAKEG